MGEKVAVTDVKADLATAVGLLALSDCTVAEAAQRAGVTRWELEDALDRGDLAERLGVEREGNVAADIDKLLDERSP
ncbi:MULTISPECIES: hypothetical protein [Salinibaculum]|uniref:hypothetical protein n=1 Tax=Salinibaculum TaxID=2732368 RepID=UPI0030CC2FB3